MTAEMVVKHQTLSAKDYSSSLKDKSEIILPANEKVSIYNSSLQKVFAFQSNDEVPLSILQKISKLPESEKFIFNDHDFQSVGIKYTNKLNEEYLLISQGIFFFRGTGSAFLHTHAGFYYYFIGWIKWIFIFISGIITYHPHHSANECGISFSNRKAFENGCK